MPTRRGPGTLFGKVVRGSTQGPVHRLLNDSSGACPEHPSSSHHTSPQGGLSVMLGLQPRSLSSGLFKANALHDQRCPTLEGKSTPCSPVPAGELLPGAIWTQGLNPSPPDRRGCSHSQACPVVAAKAHVCSSCHHQSPTEIHFLIPRSRQWAGDAAFPTMGSSGRQPG